MKVIVRKALECSVSSPAGPWDQKVLLWLCASLQPLERRDHELPKFNWNGWIVLAVFRKLSIKKKSKQKKQLCILRLTTPLLMDWLADSLWWQWNMFRCSPDHLFKNSICYIFWTAFPLSCLCNLFELLTALQLNKMKEKPELSISWTLFFLKSLMLIYLKGTSFRRKLETLLNNVLWLKIWDREDLILFCS